MTSVTALLARCRTRLLIPPAAFLVVGMGACADCSEPTMPAAPNAPAADRAIDAVDQQLDKLRNRHRKQRKEATPADSLLPADTGTQADAG